MALAILCAVLLLMAPVVLGLLGVLAALVLAAVWVKAGLRAGRWFYLRPVSVLSVGERAAWTASVVILLFGLAAATFSVFLDGRIAEPFQLPLSFGGPPVGSRAVTYSDPQTQEAIKRAFEASSVPHRIEKWDDGKEWISWVPKDNEAAERVILAVVGDPLPNGRNVSLADPRDEEEFMKWLTARGVPYRRALSHGKFYIVWEGDETSQVLMEQFHRDQAAPALARPQDCPKGSPGTTSGTTKKGC